MSINDILAAWHNLLTWLSALTLGQIWARIYNPPNARNLIVAAAIIGPEVPKYVKRFKAWRESRRVVSFKWTLPDAAKDGWKGEVIENPSLSSHDKHPELLPSGPGLRGVEFLTCYDPSTGYHLDTIPLLSADQVAAQLESAERAAPAWAKTTFSQRQMLLRSLKAWVLKDMDGICRVACRDTGKTKVDAVFGEILTTLAKIDWLLKHGEGVLAPSKRPGNLLMAHKVSKVHYQPLGLCLALVSWNYSFHNLISPILAALFAGNTIVVKCSEQVAWSSRYFMDGIKACIKACGMDEHAVELVVCLPEIADTLARNPRVKHITFIGSEPVGRKVSAAAAEIMVPTCIELGGKDPAFLLPSADVKEWSSHLMRGVYQSAGQNCIGIELVMVPRTLYPSLVSMLQPRVKALRVGTDVGSLFSCMPINKLENIVASAEKQGAEVLAGGKRYHHPEYPEGSYFEPTLVGNVTFDMDIANTELFAPVMSVVPYDSVDEAIAWLNKSRFGLGAGVYGNDKAECRRVADALECGMVSINDFGVFYLNQAAPFGGFKASGHGRFGGEEGLRSLCNPKVIVEDRIFGYIRTRIPAPVDFPLPDATVYWGFLRGLVHLAYGPSLWTQAKGLLGLIKASINYKAVETI
ncbi:putative meiotic recombination-related protein [Kockovaella imperatae]|uniref:Putative meiotic recombination-related protein n=1 Tax=Kockovaella imperatae TaxID=4999 RepID=A0A1Y1UHP1_9TREE|nr:putative meiotic recombination-related protein [Kockovaella imperatae]ORX37583.1 putative meiotic recombination-related protein [Kockovaella imperatae]